MTIDPGLAVALAAGFMQLGITIGSLRTFKTQIRVLFKQHEDHETRLRDLERLTFTPAPIRNAE